MARVIRSANAEKITDNIFGRPFCCSHFCIFSDRFWTFSVLHKIYKITTLFPSNALRAGAFQFYARLLEYLRGHKRAVAGSTFIQGQQERIQFSEQSFHSWTYDVHAIMQGTYVC